MSRGSKICKISVSLARNRKSGRGGGGLKKREVKRQIRNACLPLS